MKNIIILLIFLTSSFVFSQKAKITYIASTSNYMKDLETKKIYTKYLNDIKNASDVECNLYINKNKAYYKKNESSKLESNSINMTSVLAGIGIYYYDLKVGSSLTEMEGLLVKHEKINWKLTNEAQKIGKYTCLKATAIVMRKYRDGYKEKKIIAWYTPEIPLNFGPKFYYGLPGLILSLQEGDKIHFIAKTIDLNPKEDIVIPEPPKNFERITFKEYEKIISKRFADFRKKRKRNR